MKYKKRFKDEAEQNAYMNACDCLYYGCGQKDWHDCGIDQKRRQKVWERAYKDMCGDCDSLFEAEEVKEVAKTEKKKATKKATKKVAEEKEVAKVEKKATKATAKTEVQENATTVEELTDCNIALECYEVGDIMQPPTIAPGGSLRWYKAKKAKKSEPASAPVKSEFDFATVATLDSLELFARRERNFATAAAICRKYGATMEIKGVWLWFGDCEYWDEWSTELLAAGIATHFAVEKKQDCWHEPEDGSGFGKTEQTAEQITKKYGCITAA